MVKYIVKIQIKKSRKNEWVNWMKNEHIRDVINTGHFTNFSFNQIIKNGSPLDPDFCQFEVIYFSRNKDELDAYFKTKAEKLQKIHLEKFNGDFNVERTIYEYQNVFELQEIETGM